MSDPTPIADGEVEALRREIEYLISIGPFQGYAADRVMHCLKAAAPCLTRLASLAEDNAKLRARVEELETALDFLGEHKGRSLAFDGKFYCEDDNTDLWTVTEEHGNINDREWDVLGSGKTPVAALLDARARARSNLGGE